MWNYMKKSYRIERFMLPEGLFSEALFSKMRIDNNSYLSSLDSFVFFLFVMNELSVKLLEISFEE